MRDITTIRTCVTLAIRGLALILILIGVYGAARSCWTLVSWHTLKIEYDNGFSWGAHTLGMLIMGLGLAIGSERLVRWLVPVRSHECPQCGYALKQLSGGRCPECGLDITARARSDSR